MRYDHFHMLPIRAFQIIAGRMTLEGGKGDSPDPPDYTPMANASAESARLGAELGNKQLEESKRQYENNMAVAQPVVDAQIGLMKSQQAQGDEFYNYNKDTFRPVEVGLVKDATDFSTAGAKEQYARTASADLEQQQANESAQGNRALMAAGVNPNSAKFVALNKQQEIVNAAARAGAVTNARDKADNLSWAKRMDVAGLGKGLTGAAQGAYGLTLQAGNSAVGNNAQAGNAALSGMQAGTGTIMQGQGQKVAGLGNILGSQTSIYNANQPTDYTGSLIGAAGGVASAFIM